MMMRVEGAPVAVVIVVAGVLIQLVVVRQADIGLVVGVRK
jgi:hypothetical protein